MNEAGKKDVVKTWSRASTIFPETVSYTHLDVYKRQGLQGLMNFGLGSIATSVFAAARSTVSVVSSTCLLYTSRCV